ncbi:MAG: hypothetical protein IJ776_02285 [Paludibacteraceae bacterium]|nr:hypothetical protein [Paludibacteraceae bacterium]
MIATVFDWVKTAKQPQTLQDDPEVQALRKRLKAEIITTAGEQTAPQSAPASDDSLPFPATAYEILTDFLSENGCKYYFLNDDVSKMSHLGFKFQGGGFIAYASTTDGKLYIMYEDFVEADSSQADLYARVANDFSNKLGVLKVCSTFNEESDKVQLNLCFETFYAVPTDISNFVNQAPSLAQHIVQEMQNNYYKTDFEFVCDNRRMYFLLNEAELQHSEHQLVANPQNPLTVGALITNLFDAADVVNVCRLYIISAGKTNVINDAEQIFNYDVVSAAYNVQSGKLLHDSVLQVRTTDYKYLFQLDAFSQSDFTVYIRLTALRLALGRRPAEAKTSTVHPDTVSLLIAYDKTTVQNQHSEFEFMWLDAHDKQRQGRQSELSKEQHFLLKLEQNDLSERIYRGIKFFYSERYYEALTTLLPVFKELQPTFFKMNNSQRSVYFDVCFFIGFCYSELRQYDRAYYYLEIAHFSNRYDYTQEYINALANAGDVRVFNEIDRMIEILKKNAENRENSELTESEGDFYEFLLRRRGYSCVEFHDLDNAEKIFKQLLEYPSSQTYAQHELNYIASLRRHNNKQVNNNQ